MYFFAMRDEPALPAAAGPMSLLFDVWLVMGLASRLLDDALADSGLSGDDFGMYSLLRRFGPVTPRQISRWTGMGATTVSAYLKRIDGRGHAERTPNPVDRRSYLVGLNPDGVRAHATATVAFLTAMRVLAPAFQPDPRVERLALQRVDAALRQVTGMDPRPYTVADDSGDSTSGWQVSYNGVPLDADQERLVRHYIDFVRARPATAGSRATT
jgi:DNA-binding MarR family transcriptional regulator